MTAASSPSKLQQLRELSVVVADTGDFDAVKRLRPVDCTTNPTLVRKALDLPVYAEAIETELAWARTQYAELRSGQTSAAGSTVLAWDLGPANDMETSCMHLTVLAWGEAYAELRDCAAGGAVQDVITGWLTTAEMEQLAVWTTDYVPLFAEQGYVAGAASA